jgi:hypothetical protein
MVRRDIVETLRVDEDLGVSTSDDSLKESMTGREGSDKKQKPLPKSLSGPSPNDIADLSRRTGDISLYKFYFASIGPSLTIALVVTLFLNTLAASFPREFSNQTLYIALNTYLLVKQKSG